MMDALQQFELYRVRDVKVLPMEPFLSHDKRNRTGYHACLMIFYQLLRALSKSEKKSYLRVDHLFDAAAAPVAGGAEAEAEAGVGATAAAATVAIANNAAVNNPFASNSDSS